MLKKLNLFMLMLLIVGQTILGPIGAAASVSAEGATGHEPDAEEQGTTKIADPEEVVDKTALESLLNDVKQYNEDDYTADSFADFIADITAGEKVIDKVEATQTDVNNAVDAIEKAVSELQKKNPEPAEGKGGSADPSGTENGEGNPTGSGDGGSQNTPSGNAGAMGAAGGITPAPNDTYADEITLTDAEHVKGFSFKVNGTEYDSSTTIDDVSNEDSFELTINLVDRLKFDDLNFGPGTKLKYPLPAKFGEHFTYSESLGSFGGYGDVKIVGNEVVITLNDNILAGGIPKDIEEGTFTIKGAFSNSNDSWDKEIAMPKDEKFTVNFVPKSGNGVTINKENGQPNKEGQKSDEIDWKVTVNTDRANTSANPVFTDTLSSSATGHKYDTSSVEIREIEVKPNGDTTVDTDTQNITPIFTENDTEMTISLETGKAYEITYKTIPENPGKNEKVWYYNKADYDGTPVDRKTAYVDFGKAIEKEVEQPGADLITNWTIKYNGNEQLIESDTTMSDSWTTHLPQDSNQTGGQELVNGAAGISIDGFTEDTDYQVIYNDGEQGFKIKFLKEFTKPIEIKYSTKPVDGLKGSEDFTVVNKAKHGQIDTSDDKIANYNQTDLTLKKEAIPNKLDYNNKTMQWRITANQAGYPLNAGATFVDTFTNKNMVLVPDEFVVKVGGTPINQANEGDQDGYVFTNNDEEGFTVKLNAATDKEVVIEYTTSFDQIKDFDKDRKQNYHNHVALTNSGLPGSPEDTANINSNPQQKANGSKSGSYNYVDKEFTWTIIFNYNSNRLTDAILKDKLPEEHKITEVTLEKGSINADGTFVADADQAAVSRPDIIGKHEFSHSLGEIDQPYKLVYKTKMKDDVLPVDGNNNYKVENQAKLLDGTTPNANWEREVTVKHSTSVLDKKNGKQVNNSDLIEWDFLYNTAQSKLTNVKITDTFGDDPNLKAPNQVLNEESLEVYKVKYTSSGAMTKEGTKLIAGTDYKVSFNEDGATFVLEFRELNHAIYVKYQSVFIGIKDSPISNELKVTYNDGKEDSASSDVPNINFHYGAFASTSAGEFVIIKTDEATGEAMEGVEFTLKRGSRTLISGTTDENGVLDFGMPFATGTYSLEEVTPDRYESLNNFSFELKADGGPYEGKQVVNVTNTPTDLVGKMCEDFTLTVKDANGDPRENVKVKYVNTTTGKEVSGQTDNDGKVTVDREDLPAGTYEVVEIDANGDKIAKLGEAEVKYNGDCEATVQPNTCPKFTITVKDENDEPRQNIEVIVKDEDGNEVATETTDSDGEIVIDRDDLPAGDYKVYEGEIFLGDVKVDYNDGCEAAVDPNKNGVGTCPNFTLEIQERNGTPRADVENITIKDADGELVSYESEDQDGNKVEIESFTTNQNGQIELPFVMKPGTYTVYENGKRINTFTAGTDCKAEVKPRPTGGGGWVPPTDPEEPKVCDNFTITVKEDGKEVGADVELTLKSGTTEVEVTTDANGKVVVDKADLPEGTYTAYDKDGNDVGTITVTYEEDKCNDEIDLIAPKVCEDFTVNVKEDGKPVTSGDYTFTSEDGKTTVKGSVDSNGKIVFDRDELPEGSYTVTDEDGEEVGTITVTYEEGKCEAEIGLPPVAPVCDDFTVTIKEDGTPVTSGDYTFTSEDGETTVTKTVDSNGKIVFDRDDLPKGKYTVTDKDGNKTTITVDYSKDPCATEVDLMKEDPTDPEDPGKDPEDPTDPEDPGKDPEDPTKPGKPGTEDPTDPSAPGVDPEDPGSSGVPGDKPGDENGGSGSSGKPGDSGSSGKPGTDGSGSGITIQDGKDTDKGKEGLLPKTATNIYNLLFIGAGLLMVGLLTLIYRRRSA